jgi:hypothetical protein
MTKVIWWVVGLGLTALVVFTLVAGIGLFFWWLARDVGPAQYDGDDRA